ncbi:MAG: MBL fold metallo-hydrolase [Acidobacteria bacterium]|nr:MBL fold metallo-hydrolase [Acidobacteriota bacterium]
MRDMTNAAMLRLALTGVFAGAAIATMVVVGQEPETLSITEVKDGLYYVNGVGGNVGVRVTSEGVILVDDKFPRNVDGIREQVRSVTDRPIRYVVNTHHHGDHAGGNPGFIDEAEIVAHENVRANMIRGGQEAPPRIVYADRTGIHLGDAEVQAHYFGRGHTNGDSVVYFPDLRTIHGGDLLHGTAPFIDYANGGSSKEWLGVIDGMLSLDFDTAIPGHGGVMTRADVQAFRDQFVAVRERMHTLIEGGLRKEDAEARIVTPELSWTQAENGLFMRRSIPGFYDEIAAER